MTKLLQFNLRRTIPLALATLAFAVVGCARVSVLSVVKPDGSMQRTLTYHGSVPSTAGGASPMQMPGANLKDIVVLPTKAAGWEVSQAKAEGSESSEVTVTATRTIPGGQLQHDDLGLKNTSASTASGAKLLVSNSATVRKTASGTMEYRETLHWQGNPGEAFGKEPTPESLTAIGKALPPTLASDTASLRKAALAMQQKLWLVLVGPSDPILPVLMFHPDYATYRLTQQLRGAVDQTLTDVYGSRLSNADRKAAVDKIVAGAEKQAFSKADSQKKAQTPGGGSSDSNSPPPVPLLFRVKMPGKVTATNGQLDPVTGEVVWPLYSSSPAEGDITLTATCTAK